MTLRGHRGMIKARFFLSEGVSVGENGDAALTGDPLVTLQKNFSGQA
jgi:hypothetical protein